MNYGSQASGQSDAALDAAIWTAAHSAQSRFGQCPFSMFPVGLTILNYPEYPFLGHLSLVATLTDVQEAESKLEADESPEPPPCALARSPGKAWISPRVAFILTLFLSLIHSVE